MRIDKGRMRGLLALTGLKLDLEEILHMPVDLLTTDCLDNEFLEHIKHRVVILYNEE